MGQVVIFVKTVEKFHKIVAICLFWIFPEEEIYGNRFK
jgi:hypothetical protein